jgi:hypothetical protein
VYGWYPFVYVTTHQLNVSDQLRYVIEPYTFVQSGQNLLTRLKQTRVLSGVSLLDVDLNTNIKNTCVQNMLIILESMFNMIKVGIFMGTI